MFKETDFIIVDNNLYLTMEAHNYFMNSMITTLLLGVFIGFSLGYFADYVRKYLGKYYE